LSGALGRYKAVKDARSGHEERGLDVQGLLDGGPPLDRLLAAHLRARARAAADSDAGATAADAAAAPQARLRHHATKTPPLT
jgi:hypothetical protein